MLIVLVLIRVCNKNSHSFIVSMKNMSKCVFMVQIIKHFVIQWERKTIFLLTCMANGYSQSQPTLHPYILFEVYNVYSYISALQILNFNQ